MLKAERVIVVHHTHTHYYFIRSPERKSRLDSAALWIECVRWTLRARFALSLTCSTHKNDGTHRLYGFSFEFCVHTSSRTEKNRIEQTTYSVLIIRSCEASIYRFCVERSLGFALKPLVNQTYTSSSSIEHAQRRDHTINSGQQRQRYFCWSTQSFKFCSLAYARYFERKFIQISPKIETSAIFKNRRNNNSELTEKTIDKSTSTQTQNRKMHTL